MRNNVWGQSLVLNLYQCNSETIKDRKQLEEFCSGLCKRINMKPFGKPLIKEFGKGKLEGHSLIQFIETSSITIHVDEFGNRVFIDIFSCKEFDSKIAEKFAKVFFNAEKSKSKCIFRK